MPFLINEDRALKAKLQGLTVTDVNAPTGGRPVTVRFSVPESELAKQTFPLISIEHAGIERATDREFRHEGMLLPYAPEGQTPWWNTTTDTSVDVTQSTFTCEVPIPVDLRYRVVAYTRESWHDITLAAAMLQQAYIPERFGYLEIPQDHTVRRLDLIGSSDLQSTRDENGKRLFRREYLISVSSELLPSTVAAITHPTKVVLTDNRYLNDVTVAQDQF